MNVPRRERGAALLAVLLLVAVIGAIAAGALERLRLSTALASNAAAADQARAFALGVEQLLALAATDLGARGRAALIGRWNGASLPMPGGGRAETRLADGGNCFNLNSLVAGDGDGPPVPRVLGIAQFVALLTQLGLPERDAARIAAAAADWAGGGEAAGRSGDGWYLAAETPYRAGNTLFADVSELRAVAGVSLETYARIAPFLCALPAAILSPINPDTLTPAQAPLIAMLAPGRLSPETARRLLARRPADGWREAGAFWRAAGPVAAGLPLEVLDQPAFSVGWLALETEVTVAGASLRQTSLIDARAAPARIVRRGWGHET